MPNTKQKLYKLVFLLLVVVAMPITASAAQSSSANYKVNEVFFGSGGELNACSGTFCAKQSAGELTTGLTSSNNFKAQGGFNTNREPYIEFVVANSNVNLGTVAPNATKTANATFSVKTYLADGYVVRTVSDPPSNDSHTMTGLSIPAASQTGEEQFGINLTSNTSPAVFGDNPLQEPDSSFGFGQVTSDYNTPNLYKYAKNDVIAQSNKSSSFTNYTISYIFNISNVTPGGSYSMQHNLVATSTF